MRKYDELSEQYTTLVHKVSDGGAEHLQAVFTSGECCIFTMLSLQMGVQLAILKHLEDHHGTKESVDTGPR